jgi:hypothetical protein
MIRARLAGVVALVLVPAPLALSARPPDSP